MHKTWEEKCFDNFSWHLSINIFIFTFIRKEDALFKVTYKWVKTQAKYLYVPQSVILTEMWQWPTNTALVHNAS